MSVSRVLPVFKLPNEYTAYGQTCQEATDIFEKIRFGAVLPSRRVLTPAHPIVFLRHPTDDAKSSAARIRTRPEREATRIVASGAFAFCSGGRANARRGLPGTRKSGDHEPSSARRS